MEIVMLTLVWLSYPVPIVWIASPWLKFAEYRLLPLPLAVGTICLGVGLWLFFRSHSDLGRNWSVTLEVRKNHELITRGVYRRLRHPMYASLLLYSVGQALVIPNWIAGPSYLIVLVPIIGLRFTPEERMMLDQFGDAYRSYAARTKRLIPGIW